MCIASDGVLAVVVLMASGLLFPLAAVLYCVMKKREFDEKGRKWVQSYIARRLGLLLAYMCVPVQNNYTCINKMCNVMCALLL